VKFSFIAKHRGILAVDWKCEGLGVSRRSSFLASDRTYGGRRVWQDLLTEGLSCGLHRIKRLMRLQALRALRGGAACRPDLGERQAGVIAANVLSRRFEAAAPNRKWIADFNLYLDS
jgi:putative transposase